MAPAVPLLVVAELTVLKSLGFTEAQVPVACWRLTEYPFGTAPPTELPEFEQEAAPIAGPVQIAWALHVNVALAATVRSDEPPERPLAVAVAPLILKSSNLLVGSLTVNVDVALLVPSVAPSEYVPFKYPTRYEVVNCPESSAATSHELAASEGSVTVTLTVEFVKKPAPEMLTVELVS